jgi:hypothetical protein
MGLNLTQGMDVCVRLLCGCVVLYVGSGLTTGWSHVQGVLSTVKKKDYETEEETRAQQRTVEPLIKE